MNKECRKQGKDILWFDNGSCFPAFLMEYKNYFFQLRVSADGFGMFIVPDRMNKECRKQGKDILWFEMVPAFLFSL